MLSLIALISFTLTVTIILYFQPPSYIYVAQTITSLSSYPDDCHITNLDSLRRSAIVYTWVNTSEHCYKSRLKQSGLLPIYDSDKELQYSLRSLLKYAPWLQGPIYIVTPGQVPNWLNTLHPRIQIIDQDDLLPKETSKLRLPTFNTNVFEQYLYKIPGVSDIFIHMNDDYIFVKNVSPSRFFTCAGGVRFFSEVHNIRHVTETSSSKWLSSIRNTVGLMDRVYGGQHVYNFLKHAPFVYSRKAFENIHKKFGQSLDKNLEHRVRDATDINIPLLHHIYVQEEGSRVLNLSFAWSPLLKSDEYRLVTVRDDDLRYLQKVLQDISDHRGNEIMIAFNGGPVMKKAGALLEAYLERLYPEPAPWELLSEHENTVLSNYVGYNCTFDRNVIPIPHTHPYMQLDTQDQQIEDIKFEGFDKTREKELLLLMRKQYASKYANTQTYVAYTAGFMCSVAFTLLTLRYSDGLSIIFARKWLKRNVL